MAGPILALRPHSDVGFGSGADPPTALLSPVRPVVRVPTHTTHGHEQVILGRISALKSEIEEFRGIPYGIVPGRWEHSLLRTSLPEDVFDASRHG